MVKKACVNIWWKRVCASASVWIMLVTIVIITGDDDDGATGLSISVHSVVRPPSCPVA
jgi:hypothetical protein